MSTDWMMINLVIVVRKLFMWRFGIIVLRMRRIRNRLRLQAMMLGM